MTDDTRKVVRDGAKRFFAWQGAQGVIERRDTAQAVTWVVTCYTDTWEECAFLGIEQYEMGVVCVWVMEAPPPLAHNLRVWLEGHWRVTDLDPTNAPTAVPIEKPLLPDRANPAQWNSWFDWYYRQPWGKPPSLAHMVQVASKSRSTIEKQHALWRTEHR
jgi:hypothetical protein